MTKRTAKGWRRAATTTGGRGVVNTSPLLSAGEPGAIEAGLEILLRIDPPRALDVAELLLAEPPWSMLSRAIGHALGASADERAFTLLLAHAHQGYVYVGLEYVGYPDGAPRARLAAEALGDLTARDVDPGRRVIGEALFRYRVRFDREAALAELAAHLQNPDSQLRGFAAHALTGPGSSTRCIMTTRASRQRARWARGRHPGPSPLDVA